MKKFAFIPAIILFPLTTSADISFALEGTHFKSKAHIPETPIFVSNYGSEQDHTFAPIFRFNYLWDKIFIGAEVIYPGDAHAKASAYDAQDGLPGQHFHAEESRVNIKRRGFGGIIGFHQPLNTYLSLNIFGGITHFTIKTERTHKLTQSTYYKCGPFICLDTPVTLIDEGSSDNKGINSVTSGINLEFGDEALTIAAGLRHYNAFKSTGATLAIKWTF